MDAKDVALIVEGNVEDQPVNQGRTTEETKLTTLETQNITKEDNASAPPPTYNKRALTIDAKTYELEKFENHSLLIFNQKFFKTRPTRHGTEKDVEKLKETFSKFGFKVEVENDLTYQQIMNKLETYSSQNFTDYGCIAVAVLTHGGEKGSIRAQDKAYNESEIIKYFKVDIRPTLITKPRILIIQACRGKQDRTGVPVFAQRGQTDTDVDEENSEEPYTLPVEADMLVLHSSYIGKPSHRDHDNGSWFIQVLCDRIDDLARSHDLDSILTDVKKVVAIDLGLQQVDTTSDEDKVNKQMPVITTTLIRKLYLRKFGEQPESVDDAGNFGVDRSLSMIENNHDRYILGHFEYLKKCLKHYQKDNPGDIEAKAIYDLAISYGENTSFHGVKQEMSSTISEFFKNKCSSFGFLKYIHLYNTNS